MSVWEFYLELKTDDSTLDKMMCEYNKNSIYQTAFSFNVVDYDYIGEYKGNFSSVIDNFLPANYLIFNFLKSFVPSNSYIKANDIEHVFNFVKKTDFLKFVFDAWKPHIDYAYEHVGVIMIDVRRYHQIRNKLFWKYYKKFSPAPNLMQFDDTE